MEPRKVHLGLIQIHGQLKVRNGYYFSNFAQDLVVNTVGKLDELFLMWVSSPSTQQQVKKLLATMTSTQPKSINASPVASNIPQSSSPIKPRYLFGETNKENINPNTNKPKLIKEKTLPIPQFYQPVNETLIKETLDKEFVRIRFMRVLTFLEPITPLLWYWSHF
jgi:hypothetical protein